MFEELSLGFRVNQEILIFQTQTRSFTHCRSVVSALKWLLVWPGDKETQHRQSPWCRGCTSLQGVGMHRGLWAAEAGSTTESIPGWWCCRKNLKKNPVSSAPGDCLEGYDLKTELFEVFLKKVESRVWPRPSPKPWFLSSTMPFLFYCSCVCILKLYYLELLLFCLFCVFI